ncbi:alpha/beta fold hydrolase [Kribbella sp. NPDC050241]|uniref:alpha/beta fold hydrolase n=1 Tax=Kribbella sp. NPDC050241 TaxID=3364115 RepID=UPI0037B4A227
MRVALSAGEFEYVETGDSSAPPMVLLHGLRSSAATWEPVTPGLAERWRVFALDQRGHGASARTTEYSFEAMRDDVLEFVDRLGLHKFLLVGHSMGGSVAAIFAEQHSERLTGLVLVDSPPPDGEGDWTVPPRPDGELDYDWDCFVAIFRQLADPDPAWWADLPSISAPTLVISGGSTSPVPPHVLPEVARRIPNATLTTIEGAGHVVHQTRPTEFLNAVTTHHPT